jgi:hypothetical protein
MKNLILFSVFLVIIISCSKEQITATNPINNLMNLKVGNYWVYDWYEIDANNGNTTNLQKRDSIIIAKDTVISGRTYFIKKGNYFGGKHVTNSIIFDSINSIYSFPYKEVMLTLNKSAIATKNFGVKGNPIAIGYYSLDDNKVLVQVPAGNFQSVNFKGRIEPQQPGYLYGIRYNDNYYSDNVGLIKIRTQIYSLPNDIEMRLVKYGSVK